MAKKEERRDPTGKLMINYMAHYLPQDILKEIVEKHSKHQRAHIKRGISFSVFLGPSPTSTDFNMNLYKSGDLIWTSPRIVWVDRKGVSWDFPAEGRALKGVNAEEPTCPPIDKILDGDIMFGNFKFISGGRVS